METIGSAMRHAGRNWGWMLAYGILLIVIGILALMNPVATGLAVGILVAVAFVVGGVGSLIAAFTDGGWQAKTVDILFGLLALFAGLVCIVNPFSGSISLVWIIGVMFLFIGGYELVVGFKTGDQRLWLILLGVCDLLIGFWATFLMGPAAALVALAALVGFAFLLRGLLLSMFAFKLRGLAKA